jgi:beta-1,4-N-acetylglucosaminyltransferase
MFGNIFITVGTTEFNELILSLDNQRFVDTILDLKCKQLTLQIGRGDFPNYLPDICEIKNIKYSCFRFQSDLKEVMEKSDLIISHCGAGSILEVLSLRKPLIVAVNSSLQGNHQVKFICISIYSCTSLRDI